MRPTGSPTVLLVGAGGHARVCLEALEDTGFHVIGCVTRDGSGGAELGVPVLGTDAELAAVAASSGASYVFVAVGDNVARAAVLGRCREADVPLACAISRFAMLSDTAVLGEGVAVLAGAVVNAGAVVADGAILNTRSSVDHDVHVGACAHVAVGASVAGGVRIGARALLGVGCSVRPLVTIGDDAVVGAGAAVVADVPAGQTVVGVPARPLRR